MRVWAMYAVSQCPWLVETLCVCVCVCHRSDLAARVAGPSAKLYVFLYVILKGQ